MCVAGDVGVYVCVFVRLCLCVYACVCVYGQERGRLMEGGWRGEGLPDGRMKKGEKGGKKSQFGKKRTL